MPTMEQGYAKVAADLVEQVLHQHKAAAKDYRQLCQGFGTLLLMAGPLHAVGLLKYKSGEAAQRLLLDHLTQQLGCPNADELLTRLSTATNDEYQDMARRLNRAIIWHKRLSKAILTDAAIKA